MAARPSALRALAISAVLDSALAFVAAGLPAIARTGLVILAGIALSAFLAALGHFLASLDGLDQAAA